MTETPFRDRLHEDDPEYRREHASHRCTKCDWQVFSHEKYECSYCGDDYCPDHRLPEKHDCIDFSTYVASEKNISSARLTDSPSEKQSFRAHMPEIPIQELAERTRERREQIETKQDKIKQEQKEQFASPDVNLDGSLSEPEYEEDIQSIGNEGRSNTETASGANITKIVLLLLVILGLAIGVYVTVL
ncbi:MAG: AN1-type zinc finger protein [Halorubrum sp.]|uniref:AN1-type zinc finger domain-containing protein n=1 Tax=Halorubrum sp. TaxID=1879286 RepID=UPI0039707000